MKNSIYLRNIKINNIIILKCINNIKINIIKGGYIIFIYKELLKESD